MGETEAEWAKWEERQPGHCGHGSRKGTEFHVGVSHRVRCSRERMRSGLENDLGSRS